MRVAGILAWSLVLAGTAAAQQVTSTVPFTVESSVVNQCTGEPMAISLDGRVVSRQRVVGGTYLYTVQSQLQGTATGDATGTRYQFNANEQAEYESPTAAAELTIYANVRAVARGGPGTYFGYDQQTISIDESGAVREVAHRFDFTCD